MATIEIAGVRYVVTNSVGFVPRLGQYVKVIDVGGQPMPVVRDPRGEWRLPGPAEGEGAES